MNVQPQQSRLVLEPIKETGGQIEMPAIVAKDQDGNDVPLPQRWRVVKIGTGRTLDSGVVIPIPLQEGDEVVIDARFATRLEPAFWYMGKQYIIVDYAGVLAKIERDPKEPVMYIEPDKSQIIAPTPQQTKAVRGARAMDLQLTQ